MANELSQLAQLGQQILDDLIAAYNPHNDPALSLALLPGQVLDGNVVQDGVTNPLVLSQWLSDWYDEAIVLELSDCTPLPASIGDGVPLTTMYSIMAASAVPAFDVTDAAYPRVEALIADAHTSLGTDPGALPLGVDPQDFAEADTLGWQRFHTVISAETTTTTTTPGEPHINPNLWELRSIDPELLKVEPITPLLVEERRRDVELFRKNIFVKDQVIAFDHQEVVNQTLAVDTQVSAFDAAALPQAVLGLVAQPRAFQSLVGDSVNLDQAYVAAPVDVASFTVDLEQLGISPSLEPIRLITVDDLASSTPVEQATTTTATSTMTVSFDHLLVSVTRKLSGKRWWHPEFVTDGGWKVPGMARGHMVPESTQPGTAHCMIRALLLVRDVSITGSWSGEAKQALSGAPMVGPFRVGPPVTSTTEVSTSDEITVLGTGIQVIGLLCSPLTALPPCDDATPPVVSASVPPPVAAPAEPATAPPADAEPPAGAPPPST